ncbi:MAG: hypothetical protein ABJA67_16005 [Chthonomonadales bacterium]
MIAIRGRFSLVVLLPLLFVAGCRHKVVSGQAKAPPSTAQPDTSYQDMLPAVSHDGSRVAFMRVYADSCVQLCLADIKLQHVEALTIPDLLGHDRPLRGDRTQYYPLDRPAWSPDDSIIAYPASEWFELEDGESQPGLAINGFDLKAHRIVPLAIHPDLKEDPYYWFHDPQWSANGKYLSVIGEGSAGQTELFLRRVGDNSPKLKSSNPESKRDRGSVSWSPTGNRLAIREGVLAAVSADPVEILRVMEPGGTTSFEVARIRTEDARKLFGLDRNAIISPRILNTCWNPEGTEIAVSITTDPKTTSTCKTFWVSSIPTTQKLEHAKTPDRWLHWQEQVCWGLNVNKEQIIAYINMIGTDAAGSWKTKMPSGDFDLSLPNMTYICANPGRRGTNGEIMLSAIFVNEFRK